MSEDGSPPNRDVLRVARIIASLVITGLITFVVILDRVAPIFTPDYVFLGDTALGLLLGALFALVGVQGIDIVRGK